ncbi:MFS transporter [Streptomyces endophyticus]|uniref:MFS transporter n=1 Tax=Streptomyces endophyticus TaxID=714166 RepID=A0ABU6F3F9_9ACTN|nr:MFS transporter [Streptomyces endophyticus]MEB8338544.1 MFS transporter [Streptomyces endophyticus]
MNPHTRRRVTLAGSVVGAVLVALDGTVLTIAQPALQGDLGASLAQVQWTSTGYLIAVASLLVFAGRLGDRYGHARLFGYGMLGFAAASAGIGVTPDIHWVIALRVVQGVCGALLQPATLGMLRAAYPAESLGMPIALRTSAIGVAAAAGPLVGGVLTAHLGWRSVFFLGVLPAVAIAVLVLAGRDRAAVDGTRAVGLDPSGALLLAVALGCLVAALAALPGTGWSAGTVLLAAGAGTAVAAFVVHERRAKDPLLPLGLLTSPAVAPALGILLTASAALFGTLFVATYFLQDVLGLDPLGTALRMLPAALCMVLAAPLTPVLLRRYGSRATTSGGMLLLAAGVFGFGRLDTSASQLAIGACAFAMGTGFGTVMVAATESLVRRADLGAAGVAGGLQQTAMNVGPTLGMATATTLLASGADFVASMGVTLTALAVLVLAAGAVAARLPDGAQQGTARAPARAP